MLMTGDIRLFVLAGFTQEEMEKAFEFAEEFDATSVKVSKCGTIEFVFDMCGEGPNQPEYKFDLRQRPTPIIASFCAYLHECGANNRWRNWFFLPKKRCFCLRSHAYVHN